MTSGHSIIQSELMIPGNKSKDAGFGKMSGAETLVLTSGALSEG